MANLVAQSPVENLTPQALAPDGPLATSFLDTRQTRCNAPSRSSLPAPAVRLVPVDLQGGEITLLEAGTGTGKSLGYLLPLALNAALTGERAMVSTHTLALMQQLTAVDGPAAIAAVERLTGRRVTMAPRQGRRNYVDPEQNRRCDGGAARNRRRVG